MSVYLHRGIPSSWSLLQHVVRLRPNIWATSSNVKPEVQSGSTCSMLTIRRGLPLLVPVRSTCCWGLMVDDVTEQVFKLESSTRCYSLPSTQICLRYSTSSSYLKDSKICKELSSEFSTSSSRKHSESFNRRSFGYTLAAHCWKGTSTYCTKSEGI